MQRTLDANLVWYRRNFPEKYKIVKTVRSVLEEKFEQFPDAFCVDAVRLLLELLPNLSLVCGRFRNGKMERGFLHVWVFDMDAGCHIDVTADQFAPYEHKLVFFKPTQTVEMQKFGYTVSPLETFNELFRGPYRRFAAKDYKVFGKVPLSTLAASVRS